MPTDSVAAADAAILDKITELAHAISGNPEGSFEIGAAPKLGYTINQLAEARAWLRVTAQPHGGSATPES